MKLREYIENLAQVRDLNSYLEIAEFPKTVDYLIVMAFCERWKESQDTRVLRQAHELLTSPGWIGVDVEAVK